jgi:hypothetical protein
MIELVDPETGRTVKVLHGLTIAHGPYMTREAWEALHPAPQSYIAAWLRRRAARIAEALPALDALGLVEITEDGLSLDFPHSTARVVGFLFRRFWNSSRPAWTEITEHVLIQGDSPCVESIRVSVDELASVGEWESWRPVFGSMTRTEKTPHRGH